MRARIRKSKEAEKALKALRDVLLKKYESQLPLFPDDHLTEFDALFPPHLEEFLEEKEREQGDEPSRSKLLNFRGEDRLYDRDEGRALEIAIKDLMRLDRYEKRALSLRRCAIFAFIGLKTVERLRPSEAERLPN